MKDKKIPFNIMVELEDLGIDYTKVKYRGFTHDTIILETASGKVWNVKR